MLSNTWSFVRTFREIQIKNKQLVLFDALRNCFYFSYIIIPFHPTVPSGSTSSRCLASPLCMPVRTKEPGLVVLLRTRKSPSSSSSFSASRRLITPWYHDWPSSSSCALKASERTSRGLELSTDATLWRAEACDWVCPWDSGWDCDWMASSKGSGVKDTSVKQESRSETLRRNFHLFAEVKVANSQLGP